MSARATVSSRAIDHLVLAVPDLDVAAGLFTRHGFTLTPRAQHNDEMGTANQLAQFKDRSFVEILTVDRPDRLREHDRSAKSAFFGFGAHNRDFLARQAGLNQGAGVSMVVFQTQNAQADRDRFARQGLGDFARYDFGRAAIRPDGGINQVAFRLAFAESDSMPGLAFFCCENRFPANFWRPDWQHHDNGAAGIRSLVIETAETDRAAAFIGKLAECTPKAAKDGYDIRCGTTQTIKIRHPFAAKDSDAARITEIELVSPCRRSVQLTCGNLRVIAR